jgi:tetratricopeptide (TPR) repeat protein
LVQKARGYVLNYNREALTDAEGLLRRAIELDSGYAAAQAALGSVLAERVLNGFSDDIDADSSAAIDASRTALARASEDPFVLKLAGMVSSICGDPQSAIEFLRSSVEIAPYDFGAWGYLGWPLTATGSAEDLLEVHRIMDQIIGTAPEHPGLAYWLYHKSAAFTCQGDLDAAREFAEKAVKRHQSLSWVWLSFANVLADLGEVDEAHRAIGKAAKLNEWMTPAHFTKRIRVMTASDEVVQRRTSGLQLIGGDA